MDDLKQVTKEPEININLMALIKLLWHWAWLIILAGILAGTAAFLISRQITPIYEAKTSVLVNQSPVTRTLDSSSLTTSERLTTTYSQMMVKTPILEEIARRLGLIIPMDKLEKMISVQPVMNTQLIEVAVESTDPTAASLIANTLVDVFSTEIQEVQSNRYSQSKLNLENKLSEVQKNLDIYTSLASSSINEMDRQEYSAKADQYREIYLSLIQSIQDVWLSEAQSISSVVVVEPASIPEKPKKPRVLLNTALAAFVGFILAGAMVVAREALDDTLRTPEDINRQLNLPVLGMIEYFPNNKEKNLITADQPRSPITEGFRALRENIKFASIDHSLHTLLVTSSEPGDGKSTVAANLAVVFSQADTNTILLDGDLRRPMIHNYFKISNRYGLSNLLFQKDFAINESSTHQPLNNLLVVTSGTLPPNPAELLASERMRLFLKNLQDQADLIIIDTPPIQVVTDAASLAPVMDGVILVIQPGKTHISAARSTVEQLKRAKARVLGVAINLIEIKRSRYAHLYGYKNGRKSYREYYHEEIESKD